MYAKRIKCNKCGRTLLTGCTRNVVSIECSCGEVTYPNEKNNWGNDDYAKMRHNKYKEG